MSDTRAEAQLEGAHYLIESLRSDIRKLKAEMDAATEHMACGHLQADWVDLCAPSESCGPRMGCHTCAEIQAAHSAGYLEGTTDCSTEKKEYDDMRILAVRASSAGAMREAAAKILDPYGVTDSDIRRVAKEIRNLPLPAPQQKFLDSQLAKARAVPTAIIVYLRNCSAELRKNADARRDSAKCMGEATAEDLQAAQGIAEKMANRKLPRSTVKAARQSAEIDGRIAAKYEAEATQLEQWTAQLEAASLGEGTDG